jgi:outer membrane protein W
MKRGVLALTIAGAALAAGAARAEGMAGNTQFLIGQTFLSDDWKPLDEPSAFGVQVNFAPEQSPVRVALGFNAAFDSKHVSRPVFGQTGKVGVGYLEFSAGAAWHPVKKGVVRPYLGVGIARVFVGIGSGSDFWSGGDSDQSFGFYGNAGVFFKVGDVFNIGFDGRLVRGTNISIGGVDTNANYGQASLLLGFSWGHPHDQHVTSESASEGP